MRITTTLAAAAAIAAFSTTASAGGMAEPEMTPPVVVTEPAPEPSSVNPIYALGALLVAVLVAASL